MLSIVYSRVGKKEVYILFEKVRRNFFLFRRKNISQLFFCLNRDCVVVLADLTILMYPIASHLSEPVQRQRSALNRVFSRKVTVVFAIRFIFVLQLFQNSLYIFLRICRELCDLAVQLREKDDEHQREIENLQREVDRLQVNYRLNIVFPKKTQTRKFKLKKKVFFFRFVQACNV